MIKKLNKKMEHFTNKDLLFLLGISIFLPLGILLIPLILLVFTARLFQKARVYYGL